MLSINGVIQREMGNPDWNKSVPQNDMLVMLRKSSNDLVFSLIVRTFDGNIENLFFPENKNLQRSFKFMEKIVGKRKKMKDLLVFDQQ